MSKHNWKDPYRQQNKDAKEEKEYLLGTQDGAYCKTWSAYGGDTCYQWPASKAYADGFRDASGWVLSEYHQMIY